MNKETKTLNEKVMDEMVEKVEDMVAAHFNKVFTKESRQSDILSSVEIHLWTHCYDCISQFIDNYLPTKSAEKISAFKKIIMTYRLYKDSIHFLEHEDFKDLTNIVDEFVMSKNEEE